MEIEELTKVQLILLALLVSFVTSIATGIVTVSLLDQAPPAVTRTINRVVERTVERVVPSQTNQSASVVTEEVTVVVKEEDLITESIEKNAKSLVRLYSIPSAEGERMLLGIGMFVSKGGLIATDASLVARGTSYQVTVSDDSIFNAEVIQQTGDLALLSVVQDEEEVREFNPVTFTDVSSLKLGQTVIAFGGEERDQIAVGVISGLIKETATSSAATSSPALAISLIDTTVSSKAVVAGSPLINIFGEVIGMQTVTSQKSGTGTFTPAAILPALIGEISNSTIDEENTS